VPAEEELIRACVNAHQLLVVFCEKAQLQAVRVLKEQCVINELLLNLEVHLKKYISSTTGKTL